LILKGLKTAPLISSHKRCLLINGLSFKPRGGLGGLNSGIEFPVFESGATELSRRRPYAVFYKGNDYVTARMSVIVDRCEDQEFAPLTK
jgi:hypothetical protein